MNRFPVVFLMGPTASGKTALAVALHERLPVDLISVDSAMVYRGLDIGTAKPTAEVLARAPHRLIDLRDPAEAYSAAEFCRDARREIEASHARRRIPLLVGGSMLYFRALERGLSVLPGADPALRAELLAEAQRDGWPALHARLAAIDPAAALTVRPTDPQRIQRALEVHRLTGQPWSRLCAERSGAHLPWPVLKLVPGLIERAALHEAIAQRFAAMLDDGLIEEVLRLRARPGLDLNCPALRAVNYRQVWAWLDGNGDRAAMIARAVAGTRQLAKRQYTWLRQETDAIWFRAGMADVNAMQAAIADISKKPVVRS